VKYPNWRKVIPKNKSEKLTLNFHNASLSKDKSTLARMSHRMYKLIKETNKLINLYFLNDLTDRSWGVYTCDDKTLNTPVMFSHKTDKEIFALIMPMDPENCNDD
jgi:DNA polymerase III sliding clamp (beta) subunit (PCNA family)